MTLLSGYLARAVSQIMSFAGITGHYISSLADGGKRSVEPESVELEESCPLFSREVLEPNRTTTNSAGIGPMRCHPLQTPIKSHGLVRAPATPLLLLLLLPLYSISRTSSAAPAEGIQAGVISTGDLIVSAFDPIGRPVSVLSSRNSFTASVSTDGRFAIQLHPHLKKSVTYLTFDGFDTYFASYDELSTDNTNINTRPSQSAEGGSAFISTGNYPFVPWEEQKRESILWTVYGIGHFIHNNVTNTMPLPWMPARWSLLSFGFRLESSLEPSPPYVPRWLRFVRDRSLDFEDLRRETERPELITARSATWMAKWRREFQQRKDDWPDGFVAGELTVSSFTNQGGLLVPLSFEFRTFHPTWKDIPRCLYTAKVTNVTNLPQGNSFVPPIFGVLHVEDQRLRRRDATRGLDGISYPVASVWPQRDGAELKQHFQAGWDSWRISGRIKSGTNPQLRRFVIWGLLIVTFILGIIYYWLARRRLSR
jgi:hypothetical protein